MARSASGSFSPFTLTGAFGLALLTGVSFFLFVKELDQYSRGILDETDGFEHWLIADHQTPLTSNGQIDLLSGCIFALESWKTRFRSKEEIAQVAQNCATESERILEINPHLSEAFYLLAYTSFLDGMVEEAIAFLAQAQSTARSDQWLAVRRVNLAQAIHPGQSDIDHYSLQDDLGLLIASNRGLDTATSLYIKYPQLREMIISSTEELSDLDRQRFLNQLTRSVARR